MAEGSSCWRPRPSTCGDALTLPPSPSGQVGVLGSAAGGGAGGAIIVRSNNFTFDDAFVDPETNATILASAKGGMGALDTQNANVVGGSGSGGLVRFQVDGTPQPTLEPLVSVAGGPNRSASCSTSAGASGTAEFLVAPPCIDADEDTFPAVECGGTDCDDGDPDINTSATELCNGFDDNCNGQTDEEPDGGIDAGDSRCGAGSGLVCENGVCVPREGGPDAGVEDVNDIELGGGLCSSSSGVAAGGALGAALVGVLGVAALARRGRRRRNDNDRAGE